MLDESVIKELIIKEEPKDFPKTKNVAKRGDGVGGVTRKVIKKELGRKISTRKLLNNS